MRCLIKLVGALMIVSLSTLPLYPNTFSFDVGQQLTQGQTDYDIGISLLEFPVASTVYPYLEADAQLTDKISISAHFSSGETSNQSEKFVDSDFRVANDPSTIYIYSESDNDIKMQSFSFDLDYQFYTKGNSEFLIGAGFKQHNFNYEVYNVHQVLVGVAGSDQFVNGVTAMTYESTESIPYLSASYRHKWSKLSLDIETQYSSMVSYQGFDDHILRSKHIDFSGTGEYFGLAVNTRYKLKDNWSMALGYQYSRTQTFGEHTQTRYEATSEGGVGLIGTGTQVTTTSLSVINASLAYQF